MLFLRFQIHPPVVIRSDRNCEFRLIAPFGITYHGVFSMWGSFTKGDATGHLNKSYMNSITNELILTLTTAMEISGGQGANGPHLFGLAPNFSEMGATVASKFGLPAKYTKNFARASGARTCHPPIFF